MIAETLNTEGASPAPSLIDDDPIVQLDAYAQMIAHQVAKSWAYVEPEDIAQEICAYVLSKPKVRAEWEEYCLGDYPNEDSARHAAARIRLICRRAAQRYCRAEVAAATGYRPEDEAFYSIAQLRELVSHLLLEGVTERPLKGREAHSSNKSDPSTGGNWLVSLLDVQRGLERIPRKFRARLMFRFRDMAPHSDKEIAEMANNLAVPEGKRKRILKHLGPTEVTVYGRTKTALQKLQMRLGGASPYRKDEIEED